MRLLSGLLLSLLPLAALAEEDPILAKYWTNSGSLPPQYAWHISVTIYADGMVEQTYCQGYETTGDACKLATGQVDPAALQAITEAAGASGLLTAPAKVAENVMVGGGQTWGVVYLGSDAVDLPSQVAKADEARVATVLRAIAAAVPSGLTPPLSGD
jgi:hypothetical protein